MTIATMLDYKLLRAGDTAIILEFGERIDRRINNLVLALAKQLRDSQVDGVIEIVPTFRSVLVQYDPLRIASTQLIRHIERLIPNLRSIKIASRHWRLPVCYDPELAPDLEYVAVQANLSTRQFIERHSAINYHIYMLGFLPGQAYMGDVPSELALPRRTSPRPKIPAGSVAIATTMTCLFPRETPCGWHLIGRSPVRLWDKAHGSIPLLAPGDRVTFSPMSIREYEDLLAQASNGQVVITPTNEMETAA